jgi:hypothetical protein
MWLASQFFEGCARALRQTAPPSNNLELDGRYIQGTVLLIRCCNIAFLTMPVPVTHFLSTLTRALRSARHFAFVEGSAMQDAVAITGCRTYR